MNSQAGIKEQTGDVWVIDPAHTTIQFRVKNFFFTVEGRFKEVAGKIIFDETDLSRSSVEATIKASNIDTHNRKRDAHLRATDFLDSENHPLIRFQSASVEKGRDRDTLRVKGTLTIRETSRDVTLDVTQVERSRSPQGEEVAYYSAQTTLDRHDFGIHYMRGVIGGTLAIRIHLQALRQIK